MPKETELYDLLNITPDASDADIKKAFRKMAMKYHPDKNPDDPEAAEKFKEASAAYEILSDPEKRSKYDKFGKDAFKDGGMGMNAEDIFSSFFGFGGSPFGFSRAQRGPRKTKDMITALAVSLEDLYNGTTKRMKVTRKVLCKDCNATGSASGKSTTCQTCSGTGRRVIVRQFGPGMITKQEALCDQCQGQGEVISPKDKCKKCAGRKVNEEKKFVDVEIDKGMKEGKKITFRGDADEAPGCVAGDLIFVIKENDHPLFKRDGVHLFIEKEIPLANALTGYQFIINHLDGRKILIKTPQGDILKPGDTREVRNEGMPVYSRPYEKGNLYVKFKIIFPEKLTSNQVGDIRKGLPGYVPPQKAADAEEALLAPVDPHSAAQEGYSTHQAAYESDSDGDNGTQGVQCSQQ